MMSRIARARGVDDDSQIDAKRRKAKRMPESKLLLETKVKA